MAVEPEIAEQVNRQPAVVKGQRFTELPEDLYIPPDALEVFLETFEGPLDLLLYLIKRQNIDILDIPIAKITHQYLEYIEMMNQLQMELAAEYLLMAALLTEIKSRMLLPRPVSGEEEDDPRADLIRRLQEYERFKQVAEDLEKLPRCERDIFATNVDIGELSISRPQPEVAVDEVLIAFQAVLRRVETLHHHHIQKEALSVRERMSNILGCLERAKSKPFFSLFKREEGKAGAVVSLLAILELTKEGLIELIQPEPFAELLVKPAN